MWSFNTLRDKGQPLYRSYYGDVTKVEAEGEHGVRFSFKTADNRELPIILGEMPVLSKAYWSSRDFEKTTLDMPLGSGPYKINRSIPAARSPISASPIIGCKDCRSTRAAINVDTIRYDYYRDAHGRARSVQGRAIRHPPGEFVESAGPPAMTARRCATA